MLHPCLTCGTPTSIKAPRCAECQPEVRRITRSASYSATIYDSWTWKKVRKRIVAAHLRSVGPFCPGFADRGEHVAYDLTVDHIVPISQGGAPYDSANLQVLCGSCNSRKARTGR